MSQGTMWAADDLPLFSGTATVAHITEYRPEEREAQLKLPGFDMPPDWEALVKRKHRNEEVLPAATLSGMF